MYTSNASIVDDSKPIHSDETDPALPEMIWYTPISLDRYVNPQCTEVDRQVWVGNYAFSTKYREISVSSWGDADEVHAGLIKEFRNTPERCLRCLADAAGCGKKNCPLACVTPSSEMCTRCIHRNCKQNLIDCVGAAKQEDLPMPLTPANTPQTKPRARRVRPGAQDPPVSTVSVSEMEVSNTMPNVEKKLEKSESLDSGESSKSARSEGSQSMTSKVITEVRKLFDQDKSEPGTPRSTDDFSSEGLDSPIEWLTKTFRQNEGPSIFSSQKGAPVDDTVTQMNDSPSESKATGMTKFWPLRGGEKTTAPVRSGSFESLLKRFSSTEGTHDSKNKENSGI